MPNTTSNNKRIAKNTLFLYLRMLLTMGVTLFTSRVILRTLGVDDYGIYNVVGGFVSMFAVLSNSLSAAISRFITYELGGGDLKKLKTVFSTGVTIQIGLSVLIILLCEIIGVWFLNNKMVIPSDRLYAANWVLQFCTLSFCLGLISVPYNAAITAHERMDAFAYIGILEVTLKLVIAYMIKISPIDKLISYAILLFCVSLLIRFIYGYYCKRHFEECTYKFVIDKPVLKEMTSFAGWSFFGNTAFLFNTQGVNMLINVYFGVAVNAARGIAAQIDSAVRQFIISFTTAVNPQITKSYAARDFDYMNMLICRSSKLSGYLLLYFAVPIVIEAHEILTLWLGIVPDYSAIFLRLTVLNAFFDTIFAGSLVTAIMATGKIKRYQIVITLCGFGVFPLTWFLYYIGMPPYFSYIAYGSIYFALIFVRLYLVKDYIHLSPMKYIKDVMLPYVPVVIVAFSVPFLITMYMSEGIARLLVVCVISVVVTTISIYLLGLTKPEKIFVKESLSNFLNKIKQ